MRQKKYFSRTEHQGRYIVRAYQILGSTSRNPAETDPILVSVWESVDSHFDAKHSVLTTFEDNVYGEVRSRRRDCRYPVGDARFAFYDRYRRRITRCVEVIALQVMADISPSRWELS